MRISRLRRALNASPPANQNSYINDTPHNPLSLLQLSYFIRSRTTFFIIQSDTSQLLSVSQIQYQQLQPPNFHFSQPQSRPWHPTAVNRNLPTRRTRKPCAFMANFSTRPKSLISRDRTPKTRQVHTSTESITKDGRTRKLPALIDTRSSRFHGLPATFSTLYNMFACQYASTLG